MKRFVGSVGAILLVSVVGISQVVTSDVPKLSDADLVRLVVFQDLLKPWLPEPTPESSAYLAKSFYFSIEGKKDPSHQLMEALGKARVPLLKGSRSFISDPDGSIVLDKKTRKRGILFLIYSFSWKGKDEARVTAGNHEGNMSAYQCTFIVRREDVGWKIVSSENCMIS